MDSTVEASNKLKAMCQLYGYCQIEPSNDDIKWVVDHSNTLAGVLEWMCDDEFKIVKLTNKDDVWGAFKSFFGGQL
jgi:uncharacterized sporulation protein YeaH/YhbH (DUF444 family)